MYKLGTVLRRGNYMDRKSRKGFQVKVYGVEYDSVKKALESNGVSYGSAPYEAFMRDTNMHFRTAVYSDKELVEKWLESYIAKRKKYRVNYPKTREVTVHEKVYKSKTEAYKALNPGCTYEKFLVKIRELGGDPGKAIETLLNTGGLKMRDYVEVLGIKFKSRNEACRQLGVDINTAQIRSKRGFNLIDSVFGKPRKGKRYLTDDMVTGIIKNRLLQGYGYREACDISFEDAEVVISEDILEKINRFKEVVALSKDGNVDVLPIYLSVFDGYIDYTKLARMVRERSKFMSKC